MINEKKKSLIIDQWTGTNNEKINEMWDEHLKKNRMDRMDSMDSSVKYWSDSSKIEKNNKGRYSLEFGNMILHKRNKMSSSTVMGGKLKKNEEYQLFIDTCEIKNID